MAKPKPKPKPKPPKPKPPGGVTPSNPSGYWGDSSQWDEDDMVPINTAPGDPWNTTDPRSTGAITFKNNIPTGKSARYLPMEIFNNNDNISGSDDVIAGADAFVLSVASDDVVGFSQNIYIYKESSDRGGGYVIPLSKTPKLIKKQPNVVTYSEAIVLIEDADSLAPIQLGAGNNTWVGDRKPNKNDTLYAGGGNDRLEGRTGNDLLRGEDGNDVLRGQDGDDTLLGEAGKDALFGGAGDDYLNGGAGDDTLRGEAGFNILWGGQGKDILYAAEGLDVLHGGDGDDTLYSGANATNPYAFAGEKWKDRLFGGAGNDKLIGWKQDDILSGGAGNDQITGDNGNDFLWGDEGNDRLTGGNGNDSLTGGSGSDRLDGGAGNDAYGVDSLSDIIIDSGGIDTVYASTSWTLAAGLEHLSVNKNGDGNALNNSIWGGSGSNTLKGLAGNDYLDGASGNDTLIGGAGNDTYVVDSLGDRIIDSFATEIETVISSINWTLAAGLDNLIFDYWSSASGTGNNLNNTIQGNDNANTLSGLAGDDALKGDGGDDVLYGGPGSDSLDGGDGRNWLQGYGGTVSEYDILVGGDGWRPQVGDRFILGDSFQAFYLDWGYATIRNFKDTENDKIQVHGSLEDYRLDRTVNLVGDTTLDTAIYYRGDFIGVVEGSSTSPVFVSLYSDFIFV